MQLNTRVCPCVVQLPLLMYRNLPSVIASMAESALNAQGPVLQPSSRTRRKKRWWITFYSWVKLVIPTHGIKWAYGFQTVFSIFSNVSRVLVLAYINLWMSPSCLMCFLRIHDHFWVTLNFGAIWNWWPCFYGLVVVEKREGRSLAEVRVCQPYHLNVDLIGLLMAFIFVSLRFGIL